MGWLQRLLESGHRGRTNFNRAAYNAQNQPFASRLIAGEYLPNDTKKPALTFESRLGKSC